MSGEWMRGPMGGQSLLGWVGRTGWAGQIEEGVAKRTRKYVAKPIGHAIRRVYNQTVVTPFNKAKEGVKSRYNKVRAKVTFQKARDRRIARKKGYIQAQQRVVKFAENKEEKKRILFPMATYTDRDAATAEKNRVQELGYHTELNKKTVISKATGKEVEQWELSTLRIPYKKTKEEKKAIIEENKVIDEENRVVAATKKKEVKAWLKQAHAEAKLKRDVQIAALKVEWAMKRQQSRVGKILKPWTAKEGEFVVEQGSQHVAGEKKAKVGGLGDQGGNAIPPDKTEEYYWANPKAKYEGHQAGEKKPVSPKRQEYLNRRAADYKKQADKKEKNEQRGREKAAKKLNKKEQDKATIMHTMGFGAGEVPFNPEPESTGKGKRKPAPIKLVAPQVRKELSADQKKYAERAKLSREVPQKIAEIRKHMTQSGTGEVQEMPEKKNKEKAIGKGKQRKMAQNEAIKASTEAQVVIDAAPPKEANKRAKDKKKKEKAKVEGGATVTTAQVLTALAKEKEKVDKARKELDKGNKVPAIKLLGKTPMTAKAKEQAENVKKFAEQTKREEAAIERRDKKLLAQKGKSGAVSADVQKLIDAQHSQTPNSEKKKTRAEHDAQTFVHEHLKNVTAEAKQELKDAQADLAKTKVKKVKVEEAPSSIDNPYMSKPLEKVALAAEKGNPDAIKALKIRKTSALRRVS